MSRRTREGRQSELGIKVLNGLSTQGSSLSTQELRDPKSSGLRLENSGNYAEPVVTMKTRVAVRDQTPHRFQIIPLREVKDLVVTQPERYPTPSTAGNASLLGSVGLYSHEKSPSPVDASRKENSRCQKVDTYQNSFLTRKNPLMTKSESTCLTTPYIVSKKVLTEMDLNRDHTTSAEASSTSLENYGLHLMTSSSRNGPRPAHLAPHTLNDESRTDGKHRTVTAYSTNVSEISQLFCSENPESQPVRRRNRSLTVTTIRSDASATMSDAVEVEAKLNRRHAIYRESHMPSLDKSKNSRRYDSASDRESCASSLSHYSGEEGCSQNHLEDTPKPLQDAFVLKASKPRVSPAKLVVNHSNPKDPIQKTRTLNLVKAAKADKLARTDIRGDLVYPPIILDLFRDIDKVIHDWSPV